MCEVDYRWFLATTSADSLKYYSGSVFELGEGAAQRTWCECLDRVQDVDSESVRQYLTDIAENIDEIRNHFCDYGASPREEVESYDLFTLAALCLQEFVHEYRQFAEHCGDSWTRYNCEAEAGKISGRIFRGDSGERFLHFGV